MKNYWIILLVVLSSCVTEKKVKGWLNDNPTKAAGYCADNFPPDTINQTVVNNIDSAGYYDAYMNMSYLADSLFYKLDSMVHTSTPDQPCRPNFDSLRKIVDKEIRTRLKPCIDTVKVVTNTVVDRAREKQLLGKLDEKDGIISARDRSITELQSKVKVLIKWAWLFWIVVIAVGLYIFIRLRFKLPF